MKFAVALIVLGVWMGSTISSEAAAGGWFAGSNPGSNAAEAEGIHRVKRQADNSTGDVVAIEDAEVEGLNWKREKCIRACFEKDDKGKKPDCDIKTNSKFCDPAKNDCRPEVCFQKTISHSKCCKCIAECC